MQKRENQKFVVPVQSSPRVPCGLAGLSPFGPQVPCGLAGLSPFDHEVPSGLVGLSTFSP